MLSYITCRVERFQDLSRYVFQNFFSLANKHFENRLDEMYMILFTFVTLSDKRFVVVGGCFSFPRNLFSGFGPGKIGKSGNNPAPS